MFGGGGEQVGLLAFFVGDEHDIGSGVLLVEAQLGVSLDEARLDVQLNDRNFTKRFPNDISCPCGRSSSWRIYCSKVLRTCKSPSVAARLNSFPSPHDRSP